MPMAATCRATCRPIAPTPMTRAWHSARRSGGTRSRCRESGPRIGVANDGFMRIVLKGSVVGQFIAFEPFRHELAPGLVARHIRCRHLGSGSDPWLGDNVRGEFVAPLLDASRQRIVRCS